MHDKVLRHRQIFKVITCTRIASIFHQLTMLWCKRSTVSYVASDRYIKYTVQVNCKTKGWRYRAWIRQPIFQDVIWLMKNYSVAEMSHKNFSFILAIFFFFGFISRFYNVLLVLVTRQGRNDKNFHISSTTHLSWSTVVVRNAGDNKKANIVFRLTYNTE